MSIFLGLSWQGVKKHQAAIKYFQFSQWQPTYLVAIAKFMGCRVGVSKCILIEKVVAEIKTSKI